MKVNPVVHIAFASLCIWCVYMVMPQTRHSRYHESSSSTVLEIPIASNQNEKVLEQQRFLATSSAQWKTRSLKRFSNRLQWDCNFVNKSCCNEASCSSAICDGYCGSASLQEALLFYGAYVSQGMIRRIVAFNDKDTAQDILIDTHRPLLKPDFAETARLLGLNPVAWYAKASGTTGLTDFLNWSAEEIRKKAPVAIGVNFQGSMDISYEHIVTAFRGVATGLRFYDHYDSTKSFVARFDEMPSPDARCQKEYCFSTNMYAVSLRKPKDVLKKSLVSLRVVDVFEEPNWTCSLVNPSTLTLEARVSRYWAKDTLGKKQYVAIMLRTTEASVVRGAVDPYNSGPPSECISISSPLESFTFQVDSNSAVYTKVVLEGDGCPLQ